MRETTLKIDQNLPGATEVKKLVRKSLVSYINIGKPKKEGKEQGTSYQQEKHERCTTDFEKNDARDSIGYGPEPFVYTLVKAFFGGFLGNGQKG